jgi:mannosyltransferase OCH1-like enzyme
MPVEPLIHQIWIGPKAKPAWSTSWEALDRWEYRLWDEAAINSLGLRHQDLYDQYTAEGCWNGAANIARVEILNRHGGVYIDADTEFVADPAEAPFMDFDGWVVHSPNLDPLPDGRPARLTNAVMAFTAGHPYLAAYQEALAEVSDLHPSWRTTGGELMTRLHRTHAYVPVLPAYTWLPYNMRRKQIGPVTWGIHHYGTTKGLYTE